MDETVLVVGGGPVGLFAALWLTKLGIDVRIVEQKSTGSVHSKALGVHANTLELFARLGVVGPFLDAGLKVRRMEVRSKQGGVDLALDFTEIDSPYNFILVLEQARTEEFLRDALVQAGVEVQWDTKLTDLQQDNEGVTATFADGSTSRHAIVIGCDGGPSAVRELCGIPFEGEKDGTWFALCDAKIDWDERPDEMRGYLSDDGLSLFFPLPERPWYRMVTTLPEQSESARPELSEDLFRSLAVAHVPFDVTLQEFRWQSAFQIRRRLASSYRSGRVFIAGDAAHTHSPVGGQGMNTGLSDVSNLCWKIAAVLRGEAPAELLETYEAERRPVARLTVSTTQLATELGTSDSAIVRRLRDHMMRVGASVDAIRGQIAKRGSMTEFRYSGPQFQEGSILESSTELLTDLDTDTPSVAQRFDFARGPRPGQRAPDLYVAAGTRLLGATGPRHVLLLFDGLAPSEQGYANFRTGCQTLAENFPQIDVVIVTPHDPVPAELAEHATIVRDAALEAHNRYSTQSEAAFLVRPDNYIAWRSQPAEFAQLLGYLQEQFA